MPSLKGYKVQTHLLPDDREIDVLHAPDDPQHIWAPGPQVAALTGAGRRASGYYSTSDVGQQIDWAYQRREPDPHRLYSRTRVRSTTLFAVEGLIQKTFRTRRADYIAFCYAFIERVLPHYPAFAAYHAELIMAWYEALYHFDVTGYDLHESTFRAAVAVRDSRWVSNPAVEPLLVLGTVGCSLVLYHHHGKPCLITTPLDGGTTPASFYVAQLRKAHVMAAAYREQHPASPPIAIQLVLFYPDCSVALPDGTPIVVARATAAPEPPPEAEQPVDRPLPGLPVLFGDKPCPTFGTYDAPSWIGLYVCDALAIMDHKQALGRVPEEELGVVQYTPPGGQARSYLTVTEPGLYRLIGESRKPEAEKFKNWVYREVLPQIRRYGHYTMPGAKAGPTAEEIREAIRAIIREELAKATPGSDQAEVVARLAEIAGIGRDQLALSQQTIDLVLPSHQMFLSASDYMEADGVEEALKRAPRLAEPSFGLDHCPDFGKASLWMKRLCRDENKKVVMNAVARSIAKDAGLEEPPLYIPEFRMKKVEREHVKVLVFSAACWVRLKQTFLSPGTPTLLFPGPKAEPPPPPATGDVEEAQQ